MIRVHPGLLKERIGIYENDYSNGQTRNHIKNIWAQKIVKNKRRDDEQNEEFYYFVARKTDITPHMIIQHKERWYDVLTVEPLPKRYIQISCMLAKVHGYFDTCTVERLGWSENTDGESVKSDQEIYAEIPCQLVMFKIGNTEQTESTNSYVQSYRLELETKYQLEIGDKLTIKHQVDNYVARVERFFRYQTHQEVIIELEGDA